MNDMIRSAFRRVCRKAKAPKAYYVSLYCSAPYYGGPEEGGWWGTDVNMVSYECFGTREAAIAAYRAVKRLAKKMSEQAKREYGKQCLRETEWLDARGLDDSYLPEVDGEASYFVKLERRPGQYESRGCRHYE